MRRNSRRSGQDQEDEAKKYKMHQWGEQWTLTETFSSHRTTIAKAKPRGQKEIAGMIMKSFKNVRKENGANNFSDAFKIWITYLYWCTGRQHYGTHVAEQFWLYFINNLILGYLFARARASEAMENVLIQRTRSFCGIHGFELAIAWIESWQWVCAQRTWTAANQNQFSSPLALSVSRLRSEQGARTLKVMSLTELSELRAVSLRPVQLSPHWTSSTKNWGNIFEYGKIWQLRRESREIRSKVMHL